jgi:hypothetical protein
MDLGLLKQWDIGGSIVISDEWRRKIYFGLRDLVLQRARGLVLVLESIDGATNPPPLVGLSTDRSSLNDTPSFLRRNGP